MENIVKLSQRDSTTENVEAKDTNPETAAAPLLNKATHNHNVPRNWPTSPQPITLSIYMIILTGIVDIVLFLCSVAFLAFALIVNSYDHAPTLDHPIAKERLVGASKYGPTVFPILFAAIVSRATHSIFVWRLERGERIGVLDILADSTSLTSTVTSQLRLRMLSFLGVALLITWALSPVGGQASFRQLSIGMQTSSYPTLYKYENPSGVLSAYGGSFRGAIWAIVNTLFIAAIIGPSATKNSPLDLWGNVKIPRIEYFENIQKPDENNWFDVNINNDTDLGIYASLAGIPLSGIDMLPLVDPDMNLQTLYLNLSCIKDNSTGSTKPPGATEIRGNSGTVSLWWTDLTAKDNSTRSNSSNPNSLSAFTFTYDARKTGVPLYASCSIRTTYVEVNVLCPASQACHVTKIRRSTLPHPPPTLTQLDATENWAVFAPQFIDSVPGRITYPTLLDYYIAEPSNPVKAANAADWNDLEQSADVYALRLGQLMNTYWMLTNNPYTTSGGLAATTSSFSFDPDFFTLLKPNITDTDNTTTSTGQTPNPDLVYRTWQTNGTHHTTEDVLLAHKGWVTALSIASIILIITSLVPPIMRCFLTNGPEMLINMSSLATRNNFYLGLPENGSYLDASDRARLLKDCVVRFGDVDGGANMGRLAIGGLDGMGSEGLGVERVRRGRVYE